MTSCRCRTNRPMRPLSPARPVARSCAKRLCIMGGHCTFTAAETIAALQALIQRLDTGSWQGLDPEDLNTAAKRLGAAYNVFFGVPNPKTPPAFIDYAPAPFLRPFDAFSSFLLLFDALSQGRGSSYSPAPADINNRASCFG